jgi:hypothetical protein
VTIDRVLLVVSTGAAAFAAYYARGVVTDGRAFHQEQERDMERVRLLTIAGTLAASPPSPIRSASAGGRSLV